MLICIRHLEQYWAVPSLMCLLSESNHSSLSAFPRILFSNKSKLFVLVYLHAFVPDVCLSGSLLPLRQDLFLPWLQWLTGPGAERVFLLERHLYSVPVPGRMKPGGSGHTLVLDFQYTSLPVSSFLSGQFISAAFLDASSPPPTLKALL